MKKRADDLLTPSVSPDSGAARGAEMGRVDLFVTDRCNQSCVFCYLHAREIREAGRDFPIEPIMKVLEAGRVRGYREVDISGGEPTVARRLPEIIRRARELGYDRIKMMTNGSRLADPQYAQSLADAGLTNVALSIHGSSAPIYGSVHGVERDFKRCVQAVLALRRTTPRIEVEVNTVVTRGNIGSLDALARMVARMGIERLLVQLLVPNSPDGTAHFPGHRRAAAAFRSLIDGNSSGLRIYSAFIPPCLMPGYEEFVSPLDFTVAFLTNRPDFLVSWQKSLLAAKRVVGACAGCAHWSGCRGFWIPTE